MLNPTFENGEPILKPWDGKQGAYVDFNPDSNADVPGAPPSKVVRIYGVKYLGSATSRVVEQHVEALAGMDHSHIDFSILTMHAGLDDVLDHLSATVPYSQFVPLKDYVNYLALGHVHKPYEREDWIYNPGPLETCSMTEVSWPHRGYYLVEVDTDCKPQHRAELIPNTRRGFVRIAIDVDTCRNPEELYSLAERQLKSASPASRSDLADPLRQPVVEIGLRGVLPFRFQDLDLKRLDLSRGRYLTHCWFALPTTLYQPVTRSAATRANPGLSWSTKSFETWWNGTAGSDRILPIGPNHLGRQTYVAGRNTTGGHCRAPGII